MQIDGLIVRSSILPTPKENADPLECQSAHGGLVCFACIALLLVVDACPEGMPNRFRGPLYEGLTEEGRTLEAPMDPAFLATPFRDRCNARELLQFGGGRRAFVLFAKGNEEPGSEDGASAGASGRTCCMKSTRRGTACEGRGVPAGSSVVVRQGTLGLPGRWRHALRPVRPRHARGQPTRCPGGTLA